MPNVVFSDLYPPIFLCVKTKPQILFLYSKTRVRENSCSGIFYEVNYLRIISNNFLTIWLKNLESITVLVNFRRSQAQLFFRIAAQKPFTENPCEHALFLVKLKSYACSFSRRPHCKCFPVNLRIFRNTFLNNTSGWLHMKFQKCSTYPVPVPGGTKLST